MGTVSIPPDAVRYDDVAGEQRDVDLARQQRRQSWVLTAVGGSLLAVLTGYVVVETGIFDHLLNLFRVEPASSAPSVAKIAAPPPSSTSGTPPSQPPKPEAPREPAGGGIPPVITVSGGPQPGRYPEQEPDQDPPIVRPPDETPEGPPPEEPTPIASGPPSYQMQLYALGRPLENGGRYRQGDAILAHGANLVLSVEYTGADPNRTTIAADWYVGQKGVSYFEPHRLPRAKGLLDIAYNNERIDAGQYSIILKVNGHPWGTPFTFSVDSPDSIR